MSYGKSRKSGLWGALTLPEMVMALAIAGIVFAVILPQLRVIQNSWDSREGAFETLQNGRVLMDHLQRNLSKASRITAVSGPSETSGYIEFQVSDGNTMRYDIGAGNYVQFGIVGNIADLAGPVSRLQFTCYDATDLSTATTNVDTIRSVKVEATLRNPARLDGDMTFTMQAYVRTNALPAGGGDISKLSDPWFGFDTASGMEPAMVQISATQYLCAYRGDRDDGWACILTVNTGNWSVSSGSSLEYDTSSGITPALTRVDDTHFLCAYQGNKGGGFACILSYMAPGMLFKNGSIEFDTADCIYPALSQIDTTHYLCAYDVQSSICRVVVLIVDTLGWTINKAATMSVATALSPRPTLAKVDDTHYLCAYSGPGDRGYAVILTVNTGDWSVSAGTPFEFDSGYATDPILAQVDATHYLCVYQGNTLKGCAIVLTVNTSDWTVGKATSSYSVIESQEAYTPALCQIDGTNFLCSYRAAANLGTAAVLTVNTGDWSVTNKTPLAFEEVFCATPALCQIDTQHYLCAHSDSADDGYAGVLELGAAVLP